MKRVIGSGLFYTLAVVVLAWTAYRTWHILTIVTPGNSIVPFLGVAVFDGGMVSWLIYFMHAAQGSHQRAGSFAGSLIDMIFVFGSSAADVWLGGQQLAVVPPEYGQYTLWLVVLATSVNVFLLWYAHISDPATIQQMRIRAAQDKITDKAYSMLDERTDQIAGELAGNLAEVMLDRVRHEVSTSIKGPAVSRVTSIPARPVASSNGHQHAGNEFASTTAIDVEAAVPDPTRRPRNGRKPTTS